MGEKMELDKLLNELLGSINVTAEHLSGVPLFVPSSEGGGLYVGWSEFEKFNYLLEKIYNHNKIIKSKFSSKKIYQYTKKEVFSKKRMNLLFTQREAESFFNELLAIKPRSCKVMAPISGIRLDFQDIVNMSIFEVGKTDNLKLTFNSLQSEYYVSASIKDIYDDDLAIEIAENKFLDFIRLIVFMSGGDDRSIRIKVGLPVYESLGPIQMYVDSSSYRVVENDNSLRGSVAMQNKVMEKLPLDAPFFQSNGCFQKLWDIYEEPITKKNKMKRRVLNASISIGESALSRNVKNSIIYTSMAFEMLFSLDESALFQSSIADKLAGNLAFIVGTDKHSRLQIIKDVKKFYALRSGLVHGASPDLDSSYMTFNVLLRESINELLNNEKYEKVNDISVLYEMLKEAQNSY